MANVYEERLGTDRMLPLIFRLALPAIAMCSVLIGAILNILLDPLFIFALGLGVKGAALATILSQACSAAWVISFLTSHRASWKGVI